MPALIFTNVLKCLMNLHVVSPEKEPEETEVETEDGEEEVSEEEAGREGWITITSNTTVLINTPLVKLH